MPSEGFTMPTPIKKEKPSSPASSVGDSAVTAAPAAGGQPEAVVATSGAGDAGVAAAAPTKSIDELRAALDVQDVHRSREAAYDLFRSVISKLSSGNPASMTFGEVVKAVDLVDNTREFRHRYNIMGGMGDQVGRYYKALDTKMDEAVAAGAGEKRVDGIIADEAEQLEKQGYVIANGLLVNASWIFKPGTPEAEVLKNTTIR